MSYFALKMELLVKKYNGMMRLESSFYVTHRLFRSARNSKDIRRTLE
jgi:hypothetical protein